MQSIEKGILPSSELFFLSPSNQARKLFFYVTCTGYFMYEDTYVLKRENYHSYLMMHIVKGSARIRYENTSYTAKIGDTVLMNCHKPHSYEAIGNLETIWFHFNGMNAEAMYNELNTMYNSVIVVKNSGDIVNRIYKIYDHHKSNKKISEAIQSSYISRILGEFFRNHGTDTSDRSTLIEKVLRYIEDNFEQELTVSALAEFAGLSEYYFSRLFKKESGFTIHEYLIKTRIVNAKIMLKSTNMSLREIAYKCGFSNESSFSNTFRKITGMTPGSFRTMSV